MAWLNKVTAEERRNGDGGLFSRMLSMEICFGAEEIAFDLNAVTPDPRMMDALNKVADMVTLTLNVPPPLDVLPEKVPTECPPFNSADKLLKTETPAAAPPAPPAPPKVEEKPAEAVCTVCGAHLATRFDAKLKKTVSCCLRCGKDRQANGRPIEPIPVKGA